MQIVLVDERIASDAGLLPIRELDERPGSTAFFAARLCDTRVDPEPAAD